MKTNDIKKGMRVLFSNGWEADCMDNRKGNIRCFKVYGAFTEIGDCYVHDIVRVMDRGTWVPVELTDKQKQFKALHSSTIMDHYDMVDAVIEDDKRFILNESEGIEFLEQVLKYYHNTRAQKSPLGCEKYWQNMAKDRGIIERE